MSTEGHMRFFEVSDCGFYNFLSDKKTYGGELNESFTMIQDWFSTRDLKESSPWSMDVRTNKPQCYCRDIYKDELTNEFLVVLWKSDTNKDGSIYGVFQGSCPINMFYAAA
ncbi:MAG: hypothetical protein ISEC1_P1219 [Thiomicrorhabdus sp.]|nr:MAG: hypothetical protein ISEC1_P1219 [Thiomicrorhabdus sp.]